MLGHNIHFAVLVAVIVQVAPIEYATAASSICSKAKECYVNGLSSKVCNRSEKKCNRCISVMESDSLWASIGIFTEYACYDLNDDGECPADTTECSAKLETSGTTNTDESSSQATDTETNAAQSTSGTKRNTSSTISDTNEVTDSSGSIDESDGTTSQFVKDTSNINSTSKSHKSNSTKTTKSIFEVLEKEETYEASTSDSTSNSLESDSSATELSEDDSSQVQKSTKSTGTKDSFPNRDSVTASVTPAIQEETAAVANTTPVERKADQSSVSSGTESGRSNSMGLILGIVGSAVVLVAVAGFVAWKKKDDDDDSDDDDSAFSPTKPAVNQQGGIPPSTSTATTSYTANPAYTSQPMNDAHNYGNQYGNPYHNNHDGGGYAKNYSNNPSTQYVAPPRYGSFSGALDIDDDELRRTDSILGGSGVMLTIKNGGDPFALSGGLSPSRRCRNRDDRDRRTRETRHTRSSSVEF